MMATMNSNGENGRSLPDGWEWSTLGVVTENFDGKRVPVKASNRETMNGEYPYYGASGIIDHVNDYLFDGDFLLIAEDGANLLSRSTPIAFQAHRKFWVNNHAHIVKTRNGIPLGFLEHYLNSIDLKFSVTGTAQPKLTQANLNKIPVPIPPLPEQERIVNRIEELLSDLDAGVVALERVHAGLKRYKASVLKAACEGKLFDNRGVVSGELPEGWRWATLEELSSDANYGTSQKCDYNENEFPVIRIPNIISSDIDLDDLKFAIDSSGLREKDSLAPGDLLIIRTNGSKDLIGKSALIRTTLEKKFYFASYLIRYRIKDHENVGAWISTIWESPFIRAWLESVVATTAGQYNLNIAKLNKLPIPLPPLDEQRRIVAEVERRLSVVREVESAVEVGLVRAGRLRQSVLRSAFEGRLD